MQEERLPYEIERLSRNLSRLKKAGESKELLTYRGETTDEFEAGRQHFVNVYNDIATGKFTVESEKAQTLVATNSKIEQKLIRWGEKGLIPKELSKGAKKEGWDNDTKQSQVHIEGDVVRDHSTEKIVQDHSTEVEDVVMKDSEIGQTTGSPQQESYCRGCGSDLSQYGEVEFCPNCGTEL